MNQQINENNHYLQPYIEPKWQGTDAKSPAYSFLRYNFPQIHTHSAHSKRLDERDLPLPALSAWAALSVYSAYFTNGAVKKDSAGVWVPHTELLRAATTAMLHGILPGKLREGLFRHPFTPPWHPGNGYFLLAIFSSSDVCLGIKKMEGLARQLGIIRTVKIQLITINQDPSSPDFCVRTKAFLLQSKKKRVQTQFRLFSAVPMQRKCRGGKGGQRYHRGESVVMAVLLWPCWLADSLTWDHFGQLTSISPRSEDETDPMELLIPLTLPTKHKQGAHISQPHARSLLFPLRHH